MPAAFVDDPLGARMKASYEWRCRFLLPRRTYVIIRTDGKAFHTYCRGLEKPFDAGLAADLDAAAVALCQEAQGAALAYVQSDEISVLLTDFAATTTEAWFDGNVQKLASVSASIVTAAFNRANWFRRTALVPQGRSPVPDAATFDARCFTIPDPTECDNYFRWRQADAHRNSVSMLAQAHFSQKELHGLSCEQMQELLWSKKQINYDDQPDGFKRGRCVVREAVTGDVVYTDKRTGEQRRQENVTRQEWRVVVPPRFTQEPTWLQARIPRYA